MLQYNQEEDYNWAYTPAPPGGAASLPPVEPLPKKDRKKKFGLLPPVEPAQQFEGQRYDASTLPFGLGTVPEPQRWYANDDPIPDEDLNKLRLPEGHSTIPKYHHHNWDNYQPDYLFDHNESPVLDMGYYPIDHPQQILYPEDYHDHSLYTDQNQFLAEPQESQPLNASDLIYERLANHNNPFLGDDKDYLKK